MTETERLIALENQYGAHNYKPLDVVLESGRGVNVKDVEGNKLLDMLAGYGALNQGHRHPKIMKAFYKQAGKLTLTARAFRNDQLPEFDQMLCEITGKEKVLPMNTGAEAVETALKLARKWGEEKKGIDKDKVEIITASGNFHGRTITIVSFSTEDQYKDGFGAFTPGFRTIPFGDAEALRNAITDNTAAFLVEPRQGEGGIIIPPEGYLRETRAICQEKNVLFMADEVQTGLGRTGKLFAVQHEDVDPDVLILGKALSGGVYPVSAVLADNDIMDVIRPGDHGSTYGGNPLGAAVGMAALQVIIDEDLSERSREMGAYLLEKLKEIDSPKIKEVRGEGLFIGVETKNTPARVVCENLLAEGILAKDAHEKVTRFTPPLIITKRQIDRALPKIARSLS